MEDTRKKDREWTVHPLYEGLNQYSPEAASLAVLMDIRDELRNIRRLAPRPLPSRSWSKRFSVRGYGPHKKRKSK